MKLYATKQDRWQERGRRDSALPLASQEDFLRKVVGGIQNPVFVKDESFRFVFVNEAFCRFMDRTESELLGRTDFDVVTAEHAQVFRDVDIKIFAEGVPHENEEAIANALAPAEFTGKWTRLKPEERRLTGVAAAELATPAEEAQAIALALRGALEAPEQTAALVTPDRGLARRRPNAADGRSHLLELTGEGRRMHDVIMPLAMEMERRLFAGFSDAEVESFRALLGRVREVVDDLDADDIDSGNYGVR